ncbi:hypothetical protein [Streptomyces sp. NBC_01643]|uniref:hypothetical protein n=1 Tax=Streptomyces sp. NBC_01643 TaxID=2975906 RepID=UPI0038646415|nr:hypothetical protein OHB03_34955 [Streptomyces sp. NBC_01643]
MHPPTPLPYVDLSDAQWQLLAQLVSAGLPDPASSQDNAEVVAACGLDLEQVHADVPFLTWLKLIERNDGWLVVSDFGAAVHYRRVHESSELRLSEVARLAGANEAAAPQFARAVRRLAQGSISFAEALSSPRHPA